MSRVITVWLQYHSWPLYTLKSSTQPWWACAGSAMHWLHVITIQHWISVSNQQRHKICLFLGIYPVPLCIVYSDPSMATVSWPSPYFKTQCPALMSSCWICHVPMTRMRCRLCQPLLQIPALLVPLPQVCDPSMATVSWPLPYFKAQRSALVSLCWIGHCTITRMCYQLSQPFRQFPAQLVQHKQTYGSICVHKTRSVFSRPYYRSHLCYSVASVVCLWLMYCG